MAWVTLKRKPERDPLWFKENESLAAQHGLHLPGRRNQLLGLARLQPFARLGLRLADEVGEVAAGCGQLPGDPRPRETAGWATLQPTL